MVTGAQRITGGHHGIMWGMRGKLQLPHVEHIVICIFILGAVKSQWHGLSGDGEGTWLDFHIEKRKSSCREIASLRGMR